VSLRQKLLLLFSLTVAAAVAAVAWTVLVRIRHVFEISNQEETALFVSQFQREFQHRSQEVAAAVNRVASSERARSMAFEVAQSGDAAPYLTEAQSMAQDAQLEFLEIVGADGKIVSSAQWPARFGYPEPAAANATTKPFLKSEDLPDGSTALGLFAVQAVGTTEIRLIGGERLDQSFLADLPVAPGMQIGLYSDTNIFTTTVNLKTGATTPAVMAFDPARLLGPNGAVPAAGQYKNLIDGVLSSRQQVSSIVNPTGRREDSLNATAIPLTNEQGDVMAVLVVAISRSGMVEAQQHSLLIDVRDSPCERQFARAFDVQRRPGNPFLVVRACKHLFCNHAMWNERRHVQDLLVNADCKALPGSEFPGKVHPFRPKPVVYANDV
jgi:hypothetical protein